jgi:hypothetical protein
MASLRKKYQLGLETPRADAPAVAATPVEAAKPPPVAADTKPLEDIAAPEKPSAVERAAASALKQRLQEMINAETLASQQASSQPHLAAEPRVQQPQQDPMEAAIASLPARVQRWYRAHPEFLTDPEKAAQVQYCHHVAAREVGEQFTDPYFDRMEHLLGFRQQQQQAKPNGNGTGQVHIGTNQKIPLRNVQAAPAAPARNGGGPVRQHAGPSVSAPPTREPPSMSTGKPLGRRVPLTEDELAIARNSGISPQEYQDQKEKMERLKRAGAIQ